MVPLVPVIDLRTLITTTAIPTPTSRLPNPSLSAAEHVPSRQPLSQPPPRENSMSYVAGGGFISPERPSEILQPIVLSYQTFKARIGLRAALLFG